MLVIALVVVAAAVAAAAAGDKAEAAAVAVAVAVAGDTVGLYMGMSGMCMDYARSRSNPWLEEPSMVPTNLAPLLATLLVEWAICSACCSHPI